MAKIHTLVGDIYYLLRDSTSTADRGTFAGDHISGAVTNALKERSPHRDRDRLWASEFGDQCTRRVWYKINNPTEAEPIPDWTKFKFLYGDAIEGLLLHLASAAGHTVADEQRSVQLKNGDDVLVSGKLDAAIDGHVVDVKSMSKFSFKKYQNDGSINAGNDTFGYRWQVAHYYHNLNDEYPGEPYILAAEKENGYIALLPVEVPSKEEYLQRAASMYAKVYGPTKHKLPDRGYKPEAEGKSGNLKLGIACSYCAFKHKCWDNLRTFDYARGPVFLTHVKREPRAREILNAKVQK